MHVILESITKYSKGVLYPERNYLHFLADPANFTQKKRFTIDTIIIRNPEKWKVAKLPEFLVDNQDHQHTVKLSKLSSQISGDASGVHRISQLTNQLGGRPSNLASIPESPRRLEEDEDVLIINEDVTVTELCPDVFAFLRSLDGIDNNMIRASLSAEFNRDSVFRAGES